MSLAPGTRLGPYALTATIGAGGMGEVYKATDTRLDRTVAIKVLPEHIAADSEARQRFEREAKTLAALSHPNICPIFDVGQHDGIDFLVMEYLEGETLSDRLAKGALPLDLALRVATEVADALDKAHRQGIVHRDLKPGNVMLTKSGAKLLDFGLAKLQPAQALSGMSIAATVSQPITGKGTLLGTLHYMSPEQVEGKDADSRSDIFGFGAVIYEMVTGKKAFEGKSAASVIAAVMEREPPSIAALEPLTPPALDHLVARCLSKDPDERWQSASDLKHELKWIASNRGGHSRTSTRDTASVFTRERLAWMTAVMLIALTAAGFVTWARRPAPAAPEMRLEITTPSAADLGSFALSPDGRMLVYAAGEGARSRLWLRGLTDGTSRPLDGTDGGQAPFWSPNNLAIGFFADGRLKILDIAGRSVRTLVNAIGVGGTWNRDGVIIYAPSGVNPLSRVASTGGTPQPATALLPSQRSHSNPQFLPDGRHFLFYASGPAETRGVYLGELDSLTVRRLVDADATGGFVAPGQLLFARQGALLAQRFDLERLAVEGISDVVAEQVATDFNRWRAAVSADESGMIAYRQSSGAAERRHVWFDRSGKEIEALGDSSYGGNTVTLSPDQKRAAIPRMVEEGNTDIWILDIARGITDRFTSHPSLDSHPLWSPDGTRIVFQRFTEGRGDLYLKPANGTGEEQLVLTNPDGKIPTDWNGEFVLYKEGSATGQGGWNIFAFRIDGDRTPIPLAQTAAEERDGQFSPDGKWVAYQSDEAGEPAIYVQPFQRSGNKVRISPGGGVQVRWRADGKELFYLTLDGELMSVPIRVDPSGKTIEASRPIALFKTRMAGGVVLAIARQQYTPSLDGQRFLMHTVAGPSTTPPITVILNRKSGRTTSEN